MLCALSEALFIVTIIVKIVEVAAVHDSAILIINVFYDVFLFTFSKLHSVNLNNMLEI